jgi:hypothetical protein
VSKATEVVLDVLQGAVSGAAVGALGGAVSAVGTHVETAIPEQQAGTDSEEAQKENDSPQNGESTSAAAG